MERLGDMMRRRCPSCGKRDVAFEGKELKETKRHTFEQEQVLGSGMNMYSGGMNLWPLATKPYSVIQKTPVSVRITTYEYSYRCKSCGKKWAEQRSEEAKDSPGLQRGGVFS